MTTLKKISLLVLFIITLQIVIKAISYPSTLIAIGGFVLLYIVLYFIIKQIINHDKRSKETDRIG